MSSLLVTKKQNTLSSYSNHIPFPPKHNSHDLIQTYISLLQSYEPTMTYILLISLSDNLTIPSLFTYSTIYIILYIPPHHYGILQIQHDSKYIGKIWTSYPTNTKFYHNIFRKILCNTNKHVSVLEHEERLNLQTTQEENQGYFTCIQLTVLLRTTGNSGNINLKDNIRKIFQHFYCELVGYHVMNDSAVIQNEKKKWEKTIEKNYWEDFGVMKDSWEYHVRKEIKMIGNGKSCKAWIRNKNPMFQGIKGKCNYLQKSKILISSEEENKESIKFKAIEKEKDSISNSVYVIRVKIWVTGRCECDTYGIILF